MPFLEFRRVLDRKSTRLNSSHTLISYAVFCLKKRNLHDRTAWDRCTNMPSVARSFAHLSDEAVVALVARSDEEALAELYCRFGRVAYGLARRVLRDDKLAEDAV